MSTTTAISAQTYGTLTDYSTGEDIRPATAAEQRRSEEIVAEGEDTGAFALDGRTVFVS